MNAAPETVSLDDKYTRQGGRVLLNGAQALVRALILQRELDRRNGLRSAGYVSGYRGSPLGGLDQALWAARKHVQAADVTFQPGVNEDLAATAVWGSQQLAVMGDATVDGVFAMWYGKGPGVDRSGDPLKHGNYTGTHPKGGVLAVAGDDHPGKSSTVAHHSQQAFAAHSIPTLYPADAAEVVPFALLGWAMSRASGCWVGFKMVNETAEQTISSDFSLDDFTITAHEPVEMPPEGVHFRGVFAPARDEQILRRHRLPIVQAFARANGIDRVTYGGTGARLGLVTAGKAWHDVRQALRALGIDEARARALGVSVYKVGLLWPLEPQGLREFAQGKQELFVIEEKSAFIETQAASLLYNAAERPRITGKLDDTGKPLLPADVALESLDLALVIAERLKANGIWDDALAARADATRSWRRTLLTVIAPAEAARLPYFCSGCPHNTSTRFPEGSRAISGIGCHGMALWARPGTLLGTQMGGEGMTWVGMHRYTSRGHVFQNLGDGTYFHSGLLAIRAAVASGASITYKILYNDAVAMTGGQPVDGPISVSAIVRQVLDEGVRALVLVSDDPERHRGIGLPAQVRIEHRDRLDAVQRELRETPGCTVLLYEQTCAAEKRRRRKRGEFPDPEKREFIYEPVCEGCGDCSQQSNCVSIEPHDTVLGRKRRINQSSCNKDFSCLKGFCPSFVTVLGGRPRRGAGVDDPQGLFATLPTPAVAELGDGGYGVMIPGIGGTGVITVGAVLAMAAHLEGRAVSAFDMTGLSQKNGAVFSHLQVAADTAGLGGNKLGLGEADLVLGFDMVAALNDECFRTFDPQRTRFIGNDRVQPTAAFTSNPDARVDTSLLTRRLAEKLRAEHIRAVDGTGLARALCGDTIATNMFMVGAAAQLGWLPVSVGAIERAIELNAVQVDFNKRALSWGRLWAHDPAAIDKALGQTAADERAPAALDLDALIAHREALLGEYQNRRLARRFRSLVDEVRAAETRIAGEAGALTRAVAHGLAKLMAYKDEYEVARLYSLSGFKEQLEHEFENVREIRFNMAPPLFARRDPATGELTKREYGAWMLRAMGVLARLRGLRGSFLDPFGYSEERRGERALVGEYENRVRALLPELSASSLPLAVEIADVPEHIRGFGHVKARHLAQARERWQALDRQWRERHDPGEAATVAPAMQDAA
ncbi:MAG: indolepyruvate ferredoxin oxidoreductase family protein [Burkholderiaceae bacterium]